MFSPMAFIGLPWPTKSTGPWGDYLLSSCSKFFLAANILLSLSFAMYIGVKKLFPPYYQRLSRLKFTKYHPRAKRRTRLSLLLLRRGKRRRRMGVAHLGKSESTWPDEAKTQSKSRFYEEDVFIHSFLFSSHCDIFVRKIRANRMGMGRKNGFLASFWRENPSAVSQTRTLFQKGRNLLKRARNFFIEKSEGECRKSAGKVENLYLFSSFSPI